MICSFAIANDCVLKSDDFKFSIASKQNFDSIVKVAKFPSNSKNINTSSVEFEKGKSVNWFEKIKGE